MANTRDLKARLRFDGRQFRTGMQQAQRDVGKMNKSMQSFSNVLRGAGVLAGATVGVQMVKDFNKMVIAADQLNKKTKIVFGQYEERVNSMAKATARGLGLSRDEFREATVSIADLLVPMGFARGQAVDMSIQVVKLSGALSEWSNGMYTAAEAANVVKKAMLGETEQMKNLGIKIDQTSKQFNEQVKATMEAEGVTLEQAKAIEILEQIMNKSVDAQTSFAGNQDSIARKTADAAASLKTMKEEALDKLIPTYQSAVIGSSEFASGLGVIAGKLDGSGGGPNLLKDLKDFLWVTTAFSTFGLGRGTTMLVNWLREVGVEAETAAKNAERLKKSFEGEFGDIFQNLGITGSAGTTTTKSTPSPPKAPVLPFSKTNPQGKGTIRLLNQVDLPEYIEAAQGIDRLTESMQKAIDKTWEFQKGVKEVAEENKKNSSDMADVMAMNIFQIASSLGEGTDRIVEQLIKQTIAYFIADAIQKFGIAGVPIAAGAGLIVGQLFKQAGGKGGNFSSGASGAVSSVNSGGFAGADLNFNGTDKTIQFKIAGQDLVTVFNNYNKNYNRITGGG